MSLKTKDIERLLKLFDNHHPTTKELGGTTITQQLAHLALARRTDEYGGRVKSHHRWQLSLFGKSWLKELLKA